MKVRTVKKEKREMTKKEENGRRTKRERGLRGKGRMKGKEIGDEKKKKMEILRRRGKIRHVLKGGGEVCNGR